jgi:hypothetical protein
MNRARDQVTPENHEPADAKIDIDPDACCLIKDQPDRCMANLHGTLRSVSHRPIDGVTALEAELYDGSEPLTLIWLGREVIEGIEAGRALTVHGRVGRRGNERVLYNPRYELDA